MKSYERIKYQRCPLIEVVYQVNFPTILSIDVNEPVQFQDLLRRQYPHYLQQQQHENQVTINVSGSINNPLVQTQKSRKIHSFVSQDEKWRITLANNMLALSSLMYSQWEEMADRFNEPLKALTEVYNPTFYERIGLRYVDVFVKEKLGLESNSWSDLIEPHLCGCLGYHSSNLSRVKSNMVNAEICIDDVNVRIVSGLGNYDDHSGKAPTEAFILDCDYYLLGNCLDSELFEKLEKIHSVSHIFFRDSITDLLHETMQPIKLD